ncbi:MAG: DUF933 domain-containing protein [Candidatus Omnitrophica bacterium]|nr:DUF933 domain-containing protein [Candidatus Omnitrophota bacterium]
MKVGFSGLNLQAGKVKFQDARLADIAAKCAPEKTSFVFIEFVEGEFTGCDCVVCAEDKKLDLCIPDIEKIENRLNAAGDEAEKEILKKALRSLEAETPLKESDLSADERAKLQELSLVTLKPVVFLADGNLSADELIKKILNACGYILFYTIVKKDVRGWLVEKDSTAVFCAGKIHTDLARGFIKAEVVSYADFMDAHNIHDAKAKGKVKLVGKDYIVQDGDILDIKFNV